MSNCKKYPLSLSGDTFNAFKSDFDQMLRQLLTEMEKRESDEATISIKMVVSLAQDQERDFEANGYDAMKDITKPTFKHEISTVMQVKNKKSGSVGGNMKMVWDKELCQYVMQEIDNGQITMFDKGEEDEPQEAGTRALPPGNVIDADYSVVEDDEDGEDKEDGSGAEEGSGGHTETPEGNEEGAGKYMTPFEYMSQFIGAELSVMEGMGLYTVRTKDNKVLLSSGFNPTSRFYCSPEKLKDHVGHAVVCVGYGQDEIVNISVECEDCNEVLFDIDADEPESLPDDYEYEDPVAGDGE